MLRYAEKIRAAVRQECQITDAVVGRQLFQLGSNWQVLNRIGFDANMASHNYLSSYYGWISLRQFAAHEPPWRF